MDTICRDTHVLEGGDLTHRLNEMHEVSAHQRFAAGETHFLNAYLGRCLKDPQDLFIGQDIAMIQKRKVFHRHTVDAAKIASVCHRDPQVGDSAVIVIYIWGHKSMLDTLLLGFGVVHLPQGDY